MKYKALLVSAVVLSCVGFANAGTRLGGPTGDPQALSTSDYGGVVFVSTAFAFSTNTVVIYDGQCSLQGFIASSNTSSTDYIIFYTTNNLTGSFGVGKEGSEAFRVYLPTTTVAPSSVAGNITLGVGSNTGTVRKFDPPIRFPRGVAAKLVGTAVNSISYLIQPLDE